MTACSSASVCAMAHVSTAHSRPLAGALERAELRQRAATTDLPSCSVYGCCTRSPWTVDCSDQPSLLALLPSAWRDLALQLGCMHLGSRRWLLLLVLPVRILSLHAEGGADAERQQLACHMCSCCRRELVEDPMPC